MLKTNKDTGSENNTFSCQLISTCSKWLNFFLVAEHRPEEPRSIMTAGQHLHLSNEQDTIKHVNTSQLRNLQQGSMLPFIKQNEDAHHIFP